MNLFRIFGIGSDKILTKNRSVPGTVTDLRRSYLYVVKKPVRFCPNQRNTMTSHWLFFTYTVNGIAYTGKHINGWRRCFT